jgi:L-ascorbate metabolism protein UlaG (beta-lactamase superfamily)
MDEASKKYGTTMYKLVIGDTSVLITGHIHPDINDTLLEKIGVIDVLFIPVGGSGYTLDPIGALKIIKEIEPKIVIPTNYADPGLAYPVPQVELTTALKELAMEPKEHTTKLRLKPTDLTDTVQLIVLEKA